MAQSSSPSPLPNASNSNLSLSASALLKKEQVVMITGNIKQPYQFFINYDQNHEKLKIQAKNKETKDAYYGEYTIDNLQKIGFYQNIKGFYKRLHMGIQSTNPDELRCYYWFYSCSQHSIDNPPKQPNLSSCNIKYGDALALCLEEKSKYDDDGTKWIIGLQLLKIKDTVKLNEKLEDVVEVVNTKYTTTKQQLEYIVQQVKQKFNSEKEERLKLENKINDLENIIRKLNKKLNDFKGEINENHENNNCNTIEQINQTKNEMTERDKNIYDKLDLLTEKVIVLENKLNNEIEENKKKYDEIRPKLARLKTRKDFNNESSYIEYISKKLDTWDSKLYGPILVRVNEETANAKAKHLLGYVGEPKKWNDSVVKVEWFGLGKKEESVKWSALDVYLPLSAYYYPDCPHAKLPNYDLGHTLNDKL